MNKISDEFYTHPPPLIKSILTPATPLHVRTEHSIRVHRIRHPRIPTIPTIPTPPLLLWWLCCLLLSHTHAIDHQEH